MAAPLHFQTTVGTSAVQLNGTQHPGWLLKNTHATNTVYLGGTGVTTGTGFPIGPGEVFSPGQISHGTLNAKAADVRLWAIASGAGTDVRVLVPGRTG